MLNHTIDNLTTRQEDAFLLSRLIAFARFDDHNRRCFLGVLDVAAGPGARMHYAATPRVVIMPLWPSGRAVIESYDHMLAVQFNELCQKLEGIPVRVRVAQRFGGGCERGAARLGELIRDRIIENRARRALGPVRSLSLASL